MKTVKDYQEVSAAITAHFRPGVDTNCTLKADALRQEVEQGSLMLHQWPGGLLLLRRREQHHVLNYYRTDAAADLDIPLPSNTVVEIPLRPGKNLDADWWQRQGFQMLEQRLRLTRPAGAAVDVPVVEEPASAADVMALLRRCFPPETGCLPSLEELEADLRQNRLLTAGKSGVLRFADSRVAEICHLAVAPEARGQGIAAGLMAQFGSRTADRTARVWTGLENGTARRIYERAGFSADGWQSAVLIYK